MAKRLVLAVGFELPDIEGFEAIRFTSERSFLDADVIAIELTFADFHSDEFHDGRRILTEFSSFKYRELRQHWLRQITAALKAGKTILFFLTEREQIFYYKGTQDVSGTGRNQRTTKHVIPASNYDLLPLQLASQSLGRGNSMVLDPSADVLSTFWSEFGAKLYYNLYFELEGSRPLIWTKSGGHLVGAKLRLFAGDLLILPEINWGDIPDTKVGEDGDPLWSDQILQFTHQLRDALLAIDAQLKKDRKDTPPPNWSESPEYRLGVEAMLEADIFELGAQIEELEARLGEKRAELKVQAGIRRLLFEKGLPLEVSVRDALSLLGFDAASFKQEGSEFDALFTSEEGRFLGEIEGKDSKAINVEKLSQLQRNLIEDFARDDVDEKAIGVLFGNAFRLTPPSERTEFFTQKVLKVAAVDNIALVKTTDLFKVAKYLKEHSDPKFAKQCRRAICDGIGKIVMFPDVPLELIQSVEQDG